MKVKTLDLESIIQSRGLDMGDYTKTSCKPRSKEVVHSIDFVASPVFGIALDWT